MLQFTNGVTAALRVQGGDAASASGALMQMSQALASGVVRAEEFNSINEGARPILEAVAAGWDKGAISVSKLRAIMLDGKLASKDFFDSFLRGSAMLEEKAAKAPLTVAQSMTNLHTALTKYIGEANSSYGVTERIAAGIKMLADNLDILAKSLVVIGGLYAATFIPALTRGGAAMAISAAATIRNTAATIANTVAMTAEAIAVHGVSASMVTATVASRALSAAMAFFGGPIGVAILAIGAAVSYLGVTSAKAAMEAEELHNATEALVAKQQEAAKAHDKVAAETNTMSAAHKKALTDVANLTGQVDLLTTAYGRLALEAKKAAIEVANTDLVSAVSVHRKNQAAYSDAVDDETTKLMGAGAVGGMGGKRYGPDYWRAQARKNLAGSQIAKDTAASRDAAISAHQTQQQVLKSDPRSHVTNTPTATATDTKTKPKKGGGTKDQTDDAIRQAEQAYHQALHASAQTAEERHRYALEALAEERDEAKRQVDEKVKDGAIQAAKADEIKGKIEATYLQKVANQEAERKLEVDAIAREQVQAGIDVSNESLRAQADALSIAANHERNLVKRHNYERQALALQQQADAASFKVQQDQLELDRRRAGWTEEVIKNLRAQAEGAFAAGQQNQRTDLDNRQAEDNPRSIKQQIQEHMEGFGSLNEQLGGIATNGIDSLTQGLTDAITGARNLKEAFSDMAKSIIAELIQMAIRFAIFEALGAAFGIKGLGKAAMGVSVGKNAAGTDSWRGGLSVVGEKGPELVNLPRGAQVLPNNLLRNAMRGPGGGMSGGVTNNFHTTVNANDAMLTGWVRNEIQQAQAGAIAASQKIIGRRSQQNQMNRLVR